MTRRHASTARIFAWPAAIALATLAGLVAGLNGTGAYDIAAWIGVGLPLLALALAWRTRRLRPNPKT